MKCVIIKLHELLCEGFSKWTGIYESIFSYFQWWLGKSQKSRGITARLHLYKYFSYFAKDKANLKVLVNDENLVDNKEMSFFKKKEKDMQLKFILSSSELHVRPLKLNSALELFTNLKSIILKTGFSEGY